jgi:2-polyprenyl-3-methyl-5-hydroxy-6-metoxy-1,4-benzoquinol methylase
MYSRTIFPNIWKILWLLHRKNACQLVKIVQILSFVVASDTLLANEVIKWWQLSHYRVWEIFPVKGRRILKVRCGIGYPSLVLNHRGADIAATDDHPEAESFLKENTYLNKDPDISFVHTAWDDEVTQVSGLYDIIIGSDLLYEDEHVQMLSSCLNAHSHKSVFGCKYLKILEPISLITS